MTASVQRMFLEADHGDRQCLRDLQDGVRHHNVRHDDVHGRDVQLSDGTQIYPAHREIDPATGQQRGYVVLAEEERAKGFIRPVRRTYTHLKCGTETTMGQALAETYARKPDFYSGTFCCGCGTHFPVGADGEFVWTGTSEKVGT